MDSERSFNIEHITPAIEASGEVLISSSARTSIESSSSDNSAIAPPSSDTKELENNAHRTGGAFSFATILNSNESNRLSEEKLPSIQHLSTTSLPQALPSVSPSSTVPLSSPSDPEINFSSLTTTAPSQGLQSSNVYASTTVTHGSESSNDDVSIDNITMNEDDDDRTSQESGDGAKDGSLRGGRWTAEEHTRFLSGFHIHGHKWKRVQQIVKTRTVTQVRTHAQKYLLKLAKEQQMQRIGSGPNKTSTNIFADRLVVPMQTKKTDKRTVPGIIKTKKGVGIGIDGPKASKLLKKKSGKLPNIMLGETDLTPIKLKRKIEVSQDWRLIEDAAATLCLLMTGNKRSFETPKLDTWNDESKNRKVYKCARCGVPKKDHLCPFSNTEDEKEHGPSPQGEKRESNEINVESIMIKKAKIISTSENLDTKSDEKIDVIKFQKTEDSNGDLQHKKESLSYTSPPYETDTEVSNELITQEIAHKIPLQENESIKDVVLHSLLNVRIVRRFEDRDWFVGVVKKVEGTWILIHYNAARAPPLAEEWVSKEEVLSQVARSTGRVLAVKNKDQISWPAQEYDMCNGTSPGRKLIVECFGTSEVLTIRQNQCFEYDISQFDMNNPEVVKAVEEASSLLDEYSLKKDEFSTVPSI